MTMSRRLYTNPFIHDHHQEADNYSDISNENGGPPDSPSSGDDTKVTSSDAAEPSPKKSKKGAEKRVVSVPIGDVDGSKSKGEVFPPSDSWAWRKYGQKPIKGSPYPRGYYRCSSSKGCPARKQVERSRVDPTVLLITYSFDHSHPLPASKHHNHHHSTTTIHAGATTTTSTSTPTPTPTAPTNFHHEEETDFPQLGDDSLMGAEFGWISYVASTSFLESTTCTGRDYMDADVDRLYGEEEDSLFGDLEELPECSSVFRRFKRAESNGESRRCSLSAVPCMGNTG